MNLPPCRRTIFNQLDIMVSYVDISYLCYSVAILLEIYMMWRKCHVRWLCFHSSTCLLRDLVNRLWMKQRIRFIAIISDSKTMYRHSYSLSYLLIGSWANGKYTANLKTWYWSLWLHCNVIKHKWHYMDACLWGSVCNR